MNKPFPPSPSKDEVKAAREGAGLTQAAAGRLVYVPTRTWQKWEAGDQAMKPAVFELFNIKTKKR